MKISIATIFHKRNISLEHYFSIYMLKTMECAENFEIFATWTPLPIESILIEILLYVVNFDPIFRYVVETALNFHTPD